MAAAVRFKQRQEGAGAALAGCRTLEIRMSSDRGVHGRGTQGGSGFIGLGYWKLLGAPELDVLLR